MLGFAFSSYPRYAESSVPLFMFGNVMWIVVVFRSVERNLIASDVPSGEYVRLAAVGGSAVTSSDSLKSIGTRILVDPHE
jgi:hypothetical protein